MVYGGNTEFALGQFINSNSIQNSPSNTPREQTIISLMQAFLNRIDRHSTALVVDGLSPAVVLNTIEEFVSAARQIFGPQADILIIVESIQHPSHFDLTQNPSMPASIVNHHDLDIEVPAHLHPPGSPGGLI